MPKTTFEQLPAAKRQRIIDTALAEFAEHPYAVASVSRIAQEADIAKGSIYQYFENKQELFLFLLEYAAQRQLAILHDLAPPEPALGFFALLRWQMSASVLVGLAAPRYVRLMYRAFSDDLPFRDEAKRRLGAVGEDHFLTLLRAGVEGGEINPALDLELAGFVIKSMTSELSKLIQQRLDLSMEQSVADIERLAGAEAERIYDAIIHMLRYGLAADRAADDTV